jgi:hypothetical protein
MDVHQPDFMHLFSGADGAVWYERAIFAYGTLRRRGTMLRWQGRRRFSSGSAFWLKTRKLQFA